MRKVGSKRLREGYTMAFFFTTADSATQMCQDGPGIVAAKEFGVYSLALCLKSPAEMGWKKDATAAFKDEVARTVGVDREDVQVMMVLGVPTAALERAGATDAEVFTITERIGKLELLQSADGGQVVYPNKHIAEVFEIQDTPEAPPRRASSPAPAPDEPSAAPVLEKGGTAEYDDRAQGRKEMMTVVHVERAVGPGEEPFYTVRLPDGTERQTERSRLRMPHEMEEAAPVLPPEIKVKAPPPRARRGSIAARNDETKNLTKEQKAERKQAIGQIQALKRRLASALTLLPDGATKDDIEDLMGVAESGMAVSRGLPELKEALKCFEEAKQMLPVPDDAGPPKDDLEEVLEEEERLLSPEEDEGKGGAMSSEQEMAMAVAAFEAAQEEEESSAIPEMRPTVPSPKPTMARRGSIAARMEALEQHGLKDA